MWFHKVAVLAIWYLMANHIGFCWRHKIINWNMHISDNGGPNLFWAFKNVLVFLPLAFWCTELIGSKINCKYIHIYKYINCVKTQSEWKGQGCNGQLTTRLKCTWVISTPVCVYFELHPGSGDIHICWVLILMLWHRETLFIFKADIFLDILLYKVLHDRIKNASIFP